MRRALAAILLLFALACPAGAQTISGVPRLSDADSGTINGIKFRAHGYDAPEWDQVCYRGEPLRRYRCGLAATDALRGLIAGRPVDCQTAPNADGSTRDRYGRTLMRCSVGDTDIGAWLVEHGYVVAYLRYSEEYRPQQERAQAGHLGIWAGPFVEPWQWRKWKAVDREWSH